MSLSSQKYRFGIRDPENLFRIPDPGPGVKKAPDPGSLIRIRNTELPVPKFLRQVRYRREGSKILCIALYYRGQYKKSDLSS